MSLSRQLTVSDHDRNAVSMRYVYPVLSRRAGGVSVGINLNPNNACNWRCIYCQVPDLARGGPPPVDMAQLMTELEAMIAEILSGRFMADRVPAASRKLADIAFSGNGEPTSAAEFPDAVALVLDAMTRHGLKVPLRLITNGSLMHRRGVRLGLERMASAGGEVWFKVDAVTAAGIARINGVRTDPEAVSRRLAVCAERCPTWLQSCFFSRDGSLPAEAEVDSYVEWVAARKALLQGVHLYGLARPPALPEGALLGRLGPEWLNDLAGRLKAKGLTVSVSP